MQPPPRRSARAAWPAGRIVRPGEPLRHGPRPTGARRLAALALLGVLLAVSLQPARSGAANGDVPPVPLPEEPAPASLPYATYGAVAFDLDGDGVREVVRLIDRDGRVAIDAWRAGADGSGAAGRWSSTGEAVLERGTSVDERVLDGGHRGELVPVSISDGFRLVPLHEADGPVLLAVTIGADDGFSGRPCCLTAWRVGLADGALQLARVPAPPQSGRGVTVADVEGDGLDELVVLEPQLSGLEATTGTPVAIYHWRGDRLVGSRAELPVTGLTSLVVGDSDGAPGDELHGVGSGLSRPGAPGPILARVRWSEGRPLVEYAALPIGDSVSVLSTEDGPRLFVSAPSDGQTIRYAWPAGAAPLEDRRTVTFGAPFATLGSGSDARLLLARRVPPLSVDVFDGELRGMPSVAVSAAAAPLVGTEVGPYRGPLPGGLPDGTPAWLFGGRLILDTPGADATVGRLNTRDVAALAASAPLGSAGPGQRTLVLLHGTRLDHLDDEDLFGAPGVIGFDGRPGGAVTLVPLDQLLQPERENGDLQVGLRGAIFDPRRRDVVLTRGDGVELLVDAPPGSSIQLTLDAPLARQTGSVQDAASVAALAVPVSDERRAGVVVVTPSGHAYSGSWHVERRVDPPPLSVDASAPAWRSDVTLSGRTDAGASVLVDARPVAVDAAGRFTAVVSAGPLPRDVRVEAFDPLGNRAVRAVSVIAYFDYRRLPWIPLFVAFTILSAALLWLRVPRRRRPPRAGDAEEGTFEELEAG